jgi:hypothetical protein
VKIVYTTDSSPPPPPLSFSTFPTIPMFGGEHRRLYREAQLAYIISDEENPTEHPIFSLNTDLGSSILQLTDTPQPPIEIRK